MANIRLRVLPRLLPRDGREIELQTTATHIQWRYVTDFAGEYEWEDLIALTELIGPEGPAIEMRSDGTHIQYRVEGEGDEAWEDIIPLNDLIGPQGPEGVQGPSVSDGDKGDIVVSSAGVVWTASDDFKSRIMGVATDRTVLAAMDGTAYVAVDLYEAGRKGLFYWDGSDLSGTLVVRSVTPATVNAGTDTMAMRSATSTAVNSTTDVITAAAHGFSADDEVYVTATVNGIVANARYFIYFDADTAAASGGNTDNFKLRTSLTAGALDLTGTTNITVRALHELLTGNAVIATATVNGVTANTIYYVHRVDANSFKLTTTYLDAVAGTNFVDVTASSAMAFQMLADPLQGVYVTPAGGALNGSDGAWVRQGVKAIKSNWLGAVGDDSTNNAHALQAWSWLGFYLNMKSWLAPGVHQTSRPIVHLTKDWLNNYTDTKSPGNGIWWEGEGGERSIIKCSSAFPDTTALVKLDGNINAVASVVGSRSYAQGQNVLRNLGLRGRGETTGTNVQAFYIRGCWDMLWDKIDVRDFSGDFTTHYTGGSDEVDNTANWFINRCHFFDGGKSAFVLRATRVANFHLVKSEVRNFLDYGINGALAYSEITSTVFDKIGNRDVTTTGAIRLTDSLTTSECRTLKVEGNVFENNFNMDLDFVQCRGAVVRLNSFHTFLQTGGVVTGKSSLRIRNSGTETSNIVVEANRWPDYVAPTDGSKYDVPNIKVEATVTDVTIRNNISVGGNTHISAQSAVRLNIENTDPSYTVTTSGSTPVDSFLNGVSMGTISAGKWGFIPKTSYTPVMSGLTTPGTPTGTYTGHWERVGSSVKFWFTCVVTGLGGAVGDMVVSLPFAATANAPVSLAYTTLAYTNAPFAEIVSGESRIRIRQAGSDGGVTGVPVDGSCTLKLAGEYLVA